MGSENMHTLTATYRIVTPMFLGGADPTAEAELRLPSFKGALRFWWRALQWGKVRDVQELRRKEAELFGSSETGQSKVLLRLDRPVAESNIVTDHWSPASWQRYTGYGLRDKGERCFLRPGRDWKVHVNLRRCSEEEKAEVLASLKLLGLAGGLGARSRKGWGSVTLTALEGTDWTLPDTPAAWEKAVAMLLDQPAPGTPTWTAFSSAAKWKAASPKPNAKEAQEWLARHYQQTVKSTRPKPDRAQFGLPRMFKGSPRKERRASPLILHVHQCPNGNALPCALWLPADFLEYTPAIPGNGQVAQQFVEQLGSPSYSRRTR
jgi:CRISPR-associated protein Cmr1